MDRREFIYNTAAVGIGSMLPMSSHALPTISETRRFNASLACDAFEKDPELLPTIKKAGIHTVWMAGFFYGHWPYPIEKLAATRKTNRERGNRCIPHQHPSWSSRGFAWFQR